MVRAMAGFGELGAAAGVRAPHIISVRRRGKERGIMIGGITAVVGGGVEVTGMVGGMRMTGEGVEGVRGGAGAR